MQGTENRFFDNVEYAPLVARGSNLTYKEEEWLQGQRTRNRRKSCSCLNEMKIKSYLFVIL